MEREGLLVVCGHAVRQDGKWWGGFAGEDSTYEGHVRDGVKLWRAECYRALALSGGHSRPALPIVNTEAAGMREYAIEAGLLTADEPGVLLEEFARDSFENVFFSVLAYRREFREWPRRVGVVTWKFKALRQYLIGIALGFTGERFCFYGSGDPRSRENCEQIAVASTFYDSQIVDVAGNRIVDPLHRSESFATKRLGRMPAEFRRDNELYLAAVKRAYDADSIIDQVEAIAPGDGWRGFAPPWGEAITGRRAST